MARGSYRIEITRDAVEHVRVLPKRYHAFVLRALRTSLAHEPARETRNRKLLTLPAPFGAHWEIRFGPNNRFRVLYDVDSENRVVHILGIGEKERARLLFGGEEVQL